MSHTPHTSDTLPVVTKDFDFVFVTDTVPRNYPSRPQRSASPTPPSTAREDVLAFHEEFKNLVLAEQGTAQEKDMHGPILVELFDPHELDWDDFLVEEAAPARASSLPVTPVLPTPIAPQPLVPTVSRKAQTTVSRPTTPAAPQQVVKPMTGPRLGTPKPIETWVVKVIAVLVGLNLFFAGLIVAGVRLNELFK